MKLAWKNLILVSLVISAAALTTACGGKKGGSAGAGAAAAPPPAPANPATDDSIPEGTNEQVAIYPGSWKGQLAITNDGLYRTFVVESGLCKKASCKNSAGYLKLQFKLANGSIPRKLSTKSVLTINRKVNEAVADYSEINLKNSVVISNADKNGFQFKRCVFGNDANDEQSLLRVIAYYADASRTNINVKVLYAGQKIAEGPMGFFPLFQDNFEFPTPEPQPWDDWFDYNYHGGNHHGHNNHNNDWNDDDNGGWNWSNNGGNSITIGGSDGNNSGYFHFSWN